MTTTVYRSSDASAPTLTNALGSVIGILDGCLVNGYGAKSSLGWAKEFTGTNLAAYRAASGNRLRLRVDDTAAGTAFLLGYETMTGVSAGKNPFPTPGQAGGNTIVKSSDSTPRSWILVGDATRFYFYTSPSASDAVFSGAPFSAFDRFFFYGDIQSYKPGDAFGTMIMGTNSNSIYSDTSGILGVSSVPASNIMAGHYLARPHYQLGGSVYAFKAVPVHPANSTNLIGLSNYPAPDPITGEILLAPIEIYESTGNDVNAIPIRRGRFPGLYAPIGRYPFGFFSEFDGTGDLVGRKLLALAAFSGSTICQPVLDITPSGW